MLSSTGALPRRCAASAFGHLLPSWEGLKGKFAKMAACAIATTSISQMALVGNMTLGRGTEQLKGGKRLR